MRTNVIRSSCGEGAAFQWTTHDPLAVAEYRVVIADQREQLNTLRLERQALEFLLAHACETLLFYADRGSYNAADDGMEEAAMDALAFIAGADAATPSA